MGVRLYIGSEKRADHFFPFVFYFQARCTFCFTPPLPPSLPPCLPTLVKMRAVLGYMLSVAILPFKPST